MSAPPSATGRIVHVGIIGCGEISQLAHIPNLLYMSDWFKIVYLCDISNGAIEHCQKKIPGDRPVKITRSAEELCAAPEVQLVMIANSDAFHTAHALLALKFNKHVFVEKPMALSLKDADAMIAADQAAGGNKVFVGYMRRYASSYLDLREEMGPDGIKNLRYARVRDVLGSSRPIVAQSGTFTKVFSDFDDKDKADLEARTSSMVEQGLQTELGVPVNAKTTRMWRLLGGLGSHDLSAMRELLGMPTSVLGASICETDVSPFWSCLFQYPGFAVSYESGIDHVDRFDGFIELFFDEKTIKICYDTPYIKGLPVTVNVREKTRNGAYTESVVRRTYEDPYTLEMKELYEFVANGKPAKTTPADARRDVEIFGMFMKACSAEALAST